jgi:hypothetical protein
MYLFTSFSWSGHKHAANMRLLACYISSTVREKDHLHPPTVAVMLLA